MSCFGIRYLDLYISRDADRLVVVPFLKDPRLSRRLSRFSAHPWSVHEAWPRRLFDRMTSLASRDDVRDECLKEIERRLKNDDCVVPLAGRFRQKGPSLQKICSVSLWLPLGYHPWWSRTVKRATFRINHDQGMQHLIRCGLLVDDPVHVRIAWKNFLPCIDSLFSHQPKWLEDG